MAGDLAPLRVLSANLYATASFAAALRVTNTAGPDMAAEIHLGDVGVEFRFTVYDETGAAENLSQATLKQFLFQRPDGSLLTADAYFLTDGADGGLGYATAAGDLDQAGTWRYEAHYQKPGQERHTDVGKFKVLPNLPF